MELLECINVNKKFGEKEILKDINLKIPRGKIIGLLGKNGTGKSTLIKLINDLLTPSSGEVLVNGKNIGIESKKNIAKYDALVKREEFLRSLLDSNKVKPLYRTAVLDEIALSFKLRNFLCFLCYRGTESVSKVSYVTASDGCEISNVYIKRYEGLLNYYNKLKKVNDKALNLKEEEKDFEVKNVDVKKVYVDVRKSSDSATNAKELWELHKDVSSMASKALHSDAKELIPLDYMIVGKYWDLKLSNNKRKAK